MVAEYVIRCPIHGNIALDPLERRIMEHHFFQRLRRIQQLGLVDFVYPGATHSRFSHALGVMHLAGTFFDYLFAQWPGSDLPSEKRKYFRKILRLAALLHDLGHLPFSHAVENIFPTFAALPQYHPQLAINSDQYQHEDFSRLMILNFADQAIISKEMADDICMLISGHAKGYNSFAANGLNFFPLLSALISSDLDVDRNDYLQRDAYFSGVAYGQFDGPQILRALRPHIDPTSDEVKLCLTSRGLLAFQDFLMARENMFFQVYYHKSILSLVEMLKKAIEHHEIEINVFDSLESYCGLDDHGLWKKIQDQQEGFYSQSLWQRKIFKTLFRQINPDKEQTDFFHFLQARLSKIGLNCIAFKRYIHCKENIVHLTFDFEDWRGKKVMPLDQAYNHMGHQPHNHELLQILLPPSDWIQGQQMIHALLSEVI